MPETAKAAFLPEMQNPGLLRIFKLQGICHVGYLQRNQKGTGLSAPEVIGGPGCSGLGQSGVTEARSFLYGSSCHAASEHN